VIRFASLGSGSKGNALLVESAGTRVLLDCGFGPREMATRLARLGVEPESITAVLVTHEHADHVGGAGRCAARFGWEIHASHGTTTAAVSLVDMPVPPSSSTRWKLTPIPCRTMRANRPSSCSRTVRHGWVC
jgi:glyoxylase-like metal-dependent hydrolase (beta-lactamase superfamily II)